MEFDENGYYDLSGVEWPDTQPLRRLRNRLKALFPSDVAYADERYEDIDSSGGALSGCWLTRFAESSAAAMKRRDLATVTGHLSLIDRAFNHGGDYLRGVIDVNYMEDLFYEVDTKSARWGWALVSPQLRELYIAFWPPGSGYYDRLHPKKS